jgi:iron(III) transport system ATP-binding protein
MAGISIRGVTKRFSNLIAVNDVNLEVEKGEFFTLLGPSGCGKTTLLRCVGGFADFEQGQIFFGERRVDKVPTHKRNVGMVFQNYAVFPHLSVQDNVKYGLKARKIPAHEQDQRTQQALALVRLEGLEHRLPNQLSGGQLQRVALARALVIEPEVLLMDEPLSNLDAKLRVEMRSEIRMLQQKMRITTIYVTHDQEEALSISDRIAVMDHGIVNQVGKPWEIYTRPANPFVAGFIGATNMLRVKVVEFRKEMLIARCKKVEIGLPLLNDADPGTSLLLAIRPENIRLSDLQDQVPKGHWCMEGFINRVEYLGLMVKYEVGFSDEIKLLVISHHTDLTHIKNVGDQVKLFYPIEHVIAFREDPRQ